MLRSVIAFIIFFKMVFILHYTVGDFTSILEKKQSNSLKDLDDLKGVGSTFERPNASREEELLKEDEEMLFGPQEVPYQEPGNDWRRRRFKRRRHNYRPRHHRYQQKKTWEEPPRSREEEEDIFLDKQDDREEVGNGKTMSRHRPKHRDQSPVLDSPLRIDYDETRGDDWLVDRKQEDGRKEEDNENEKAYYGTFVEIGNDNGAPIADLKNGSELVPYAPKSTGDNSSVLRAEIDENLLPPLSLRVGSTEDKYVNAKNELGQIGNSNLSEVIGTDLKEEHVTNTKSENSEGTIEKPGTLKSLDFDKDEKDKFKVETAKSNLTEENVTTKVEKKLGHRRKYNKHKRIKQRSSIEEDSTSAIVGKFEDVTPLNSIITKPLNSVHRSKIHGPFTPKSTVVDVAYEDAPFEEISFDNTGPKFKRDGTGETQIMNLTDIGLVANQTSSWVDGSEQSDDIVNTFEKGPPVLENGKIHEDIWNLPDNLSKVSTDATNVNRDNQELYKNKREDKRLVNETQKPLIESSEIITSDETHVGLENKITGDEHSIRRREDFRDQTSVTFNNSATFSECEKNETQWKRSLDVYPMCSRPDEPRCKTVSGGMSQVDVEGNSQTGYFKQPFSENPAESTHRARKVANLVIGTILSKADKTNMRKQLGLCKSVTSNVTVTTTPKVPDANMKNVMSCITNFMQEQDCQCIRLDTELQSFLNWIMHGKSDLGCCLPGPTEQPPKNSYLFHDSQHELHLGVPCPTQNLAVKAATVLPVNCTTTTTPAAAFNAQIAKSMAEHPHLAAPVLRQYFRTGSPEALHESKAVISLLNRPISSDVRQSHRIQYQHVRPRDTDTQYSYDADYGDDGYDYDSYVKSHISSLLRFSGDKADDKQNENSFKNN